MLLVCVPITNDDVASGKANPKGMPTVPKHIPSGHKWRAPHSPRVPTQRGTHVDNELSHTTTQFFLSGTLRIIES